MKKFVFGALVVALVSAGAANAQGIKRTPWQKVELPDDYDTITAIAEIPSGGASGRHTHPGAGTGYVLDGDLELVIDGKEPIKLRAGESCLIPLGAVHDARTSDDKPLKVLGICIITKGQPLATPAKSD